MSPAFAARPWVHWVVAAACATAVSATGGALTDIGDWYRALAKPAFQPPNWLFGPAWTLIFTLCVVAGVGAWRRAVGPVARTRVLALFGLNAGLNILWSLLFFHLRRPDWALAEIPLLWASIALLAWRLGRLWPPVRWLLAPYLAWVAFAAAVNAAVVSLNGPFG